MTALCWSCIIFVVCKNTESNESRKFKNSIQFWTIYFRYTKFIHTNKKFWKEPSAHRELSITQSLRIMIFFRLKFKNNFQQPKLTAQNSNNNSRISHNSTTHKFSKKTLKQYILCKIYSHFNKIRWKIWLEISILPFDFQSDLIAATNSHQVAKYGKKRQFILWSVFISNNVSIFILLHF